jgi:hypothetical protein
MDAPTLAKMAQIDTLAPAVVDRVAPVVRTIRSESDAAGASRTVAWLAGCTPEAWP